MAKWINEAKCLIELWLAIGIKNNDDIVHFNQKKSDNYQV